MHRFFSDLRILSGLSNARRGRVIVAVLLGYILLSQLWFLRTANRPGDVMRNIEGPMAAHHVDEAAAPARCRDAACAVPAVSSSIERMYTVLPLKLALPALVDVDAPPGEVIVPQSTGTGPWVTRGGTLREGQALPMEYRSASRSPADGTVPGRRVHVPDRAFVAEAILAGSGHRMLGNGQVLDADGRPVDPPLTLAFSRLRVQLLPDKMQAEATADWLQLPAASRTNRLLLRWPASNLVGMSDGLHAMDSLPVDLDSIDASNPQRPRLTLRLNSQQLSHQLSRRAPTARALGEALLPDHLGWVDANEQGSVYHAVPAGAVVNDAQGARLWIAVAGHAVPVAVHVAGGNDHQRWVREQPLARGRPIRPADWRAMGPHARMAVYRAGQPGRVEGMLLGSQAVPVITRPTAELKPGQVVATSGAGGA